MLLFQSDYNTAGGCLQVDTKNLSFIRMTQLLARMGVKNNKFFLHLSQPELAKYDPHHLTDSSMELRARIALECKVNIWYFLREVIRINAAGSDPVPYILSRANLAMTWCFCNSVNIFATIGRQLGKTQGCLALYAWAMYFAYKNSTLALLCKDDSLIQDNIQRVKDMKNSLPPYLVLRSIKDADNKEGISYTQLNNTYKTFVAQSDKIAAAKQARGSSLPLIHFDELAYYKNNDLSYPSVCACMDAAGEIAKKAGLPSCKILTTTAGKLSDPAGAYAFRIKSHAVRFRDQFYDLNSIDDLNALLDKESTNHMVYIEYSYKQLGKDDAWFKRVTADKDDITIRVDYLNEWMLGTGSNVIPDHLLERIQKSVIEPVSYSSYGNLTVYWYVSKDIVLTDPLMKNKHYIIGMDTSDCVGEDFTTLCVIDPSDLGIIATCRVNTPSFTHVAQCVCELMDDLPNSIFVPERNKNGAVLVDILIDKLLRQNVSPFFRIYNTFIQDWCDSSKDLSQIDLSNGVNRKRFGYNTTAANRDDMYSKVLINALNIMSDRVYDSNLCEEMKALSIRNGRIDHAIGGHDDLTFAFLMATWFALYGRNHHMYGISNDEMLNGVTNTGVSVDPETKRRHQQMAERIGELKAKLLTETNDMRRMSYERELKLLKENFDPTMLNEDHVSVSKIQEEAAKPLIVDSNFLHKFKMLLS